MANPQIVVDFKADTSGLKSGLDQAGGAADNAKGRLGGMGKAALIAGGAAGLGALFATAKIGFSELKEGAAAAAQTQAVIKSTGGVAGVTAGEVEALSAALMAKSGVDDEAITSGQNLLLTFTKISDASREGGSIFDRATTAALDLSVALGTDMKTASLQVGKALQDPVKGVAKLGKAGVQFSDAQKTMIERMVESGDVAGAQAVILKELETQVGGSAEAYGNTLPGQMGKAQEGFANLAGEIMGTLAPAMSAVATFAARHPALFKAIVIAVLALAAALVVLNIVMAVTTALGFAMTLPIALITLGVLALIAAVILIIVYWDQIMAAGVAAWNAIKAAALTAWEWIKSNWPLILAILTGPIGIAVAVIIRYWDQIKSVVMAVVNWIRGVWSAVTGAIGSAMGSAAGAVSGAWDRIENAARATADFIRGLWSALTGFLGSAISAAMGAISSAWGRIKGIAEGVISAIRGAWDALVGTISAAVGKITGAVGTVKSAINFVIDKWNALRIPGFDISLPSVSIAGHKIGGQSLGWGGWESPNIGRLAAGGIVTKPMLSLIGEAGPEAVIPLSGSQPAIEVRVFIGDTELRGMVRTEIVDSDTRTARTLLAGAR